jgi:hypothetical protein
MQSVYKLIDGRSGDHPWAQHCEDGLEVMVPGKESPDSSCLV